MHRCNECHLRSALKGVLFTSSSYMCEYLETLQCVEVKGSVKDRRKSCHLSSPQGGSESIRTYPLGGGWWSQWNNPNPLIRMLKCGLINRLCENINMVIGWWNTGKTNGAMFHRLSCEVKTNSNMLGSVKEDGIANKVNRTHVVNVDHCSLNTRKV